MKLKTIRDLYYGNITPCDITCYKTKKLEKISQKQLDLLIPLENKLGANINLLDEYLHLLHEEYEELQLEKSKQIRTRLINIFIFIASLFCSLIFVGMK